MNSIRNLFGGSPNQFAPQFQLPSFLQNIGAWFGKFQQFASNPIGALMGMNNINIPQNFNGSAEDLAKYLMNTGQMTQQQFEQFAQTANQAIGPLSKMFPKF